MRTREGWKSTRDMEWNERWNYEREQDKNERE